MRSPNAAKNPGFFKRSFRSMLSIMVLSSLVLAISFFVKEISTLETEDILNYSSPLLNKLGLDKEKVGEVAGKVSIRVETPGANPIIVAPTPIPTVAASTSSVVATVAIFADSHEDIENLDKAINLANESKADLVFHLGDLTNLGLIEPLEKAKEQLSSANAPYFAIPGDRDLWQTVGTQNFVNVFGEDFHTVTYNDVNFVLLNNSAIYTPLSESTLESFKAALVNADFVFMSQPLYHPLKSKTMGYDPEGKVVQEVYDQGQELLNLIRDSEVKAVLAAEHHVSSTYVDPVKSDLSHIVVGAITSTVNNRPQKLLQSPRISVLEVNSDDTYKVTEKILP